jgi:hypothetical protein
MKLSFTLSWVLIMATCTEAYYRDDQDGRYLKKKSYKSSSSPLLNSTGTPAVISKLFDQVLPIGECIYGSTVGQPALVDKSHYCGTSITMHGLSFRFKGDGNKLTAKITEASYDTKISVFQAGKDDFFKDDGCMGGNDDVDFPSDRKSSVTWKSRVDVEYHVLVHGFVDKSGNFTLCVEGPAISIR